MYENGEHGVRIRERLVAARVGFVKLSDHPIIGQRYFFPRKTKLPGACMVEVAGVKLGCARIESGHDLTLLHFHGNGEVVADYLPGFPEILAELGVNTFLSEYRGYGASTGVPLLATMLIDSRNTARS